MADLQQSITLTAEDRTRMAFESARARLNGLGGAVLSLRGAMAGLGLAGFGVAIQKSIDMGSKASDLSQRLGTTAETITRMGYATQQTGVSFETAVRGMQYLARTSSEAARGMGDGAKAFRALGIDARTFNGLPLAQKLLGAFEALSRIESASDRAAIAMRLFGRGGVELLQVTDQGAAGLAALWEQADRVGATMSGETAAGLDAAGDAMGNLSTATANLGASLVGELAPGLTAMANLATATVKPALDGLRSVITWLISGFASLSHGLSLAMSGEWREGWAAFVAGADEADAALRRDLAGAASVAAASFEGLQTGAGKATGEMARKAADAAAMFAGGKIDLQAGADEDALVGLAKRIQASAAAGLAGAASVLQPQLQQFSASRLAAGAFRGKPVQVESPLLREIKDILARIERQSIQREVAAVLG